MGTVAVGGFPSRSMAELTRSYLADHGIDAEVVADDAGGSAPHLSHATGGVYLAVGEEDAHRARQLLEQAQVDSGAATQYARPSAVWISRVGRWALAAALIALVMAWVLPLLTQIGG